MPPRTLGRTLTSHVRHLTSTLAVLLAGAGCIADLASPSLIEDTRVLAARAEVDGMPGVTWPAPGETLRVRFLVAHEAAPRPVGWHLLACAEADVRTGNPVCAAPPFAEHVQAEPTLEAPAVELVAPPLAELAPTGRILLHGIFCVDGAPAGPDDCVASEGHPTRILYSIRVVEPGAPRNRAPTLDDLRVDGDPWPDAPLPEPGAPCADDGLLRVAPGAAPLTLSLGAAPDSFEEAEEIQVSHHATAGELDATFSFLDAPGDRARVRWTPPGGEDVPDAGRIVRFWHVGLDRRGGTHWVSRALCLIR